MVRPRLALAALLCVAGILLIRAQDSTAPNVTDRPIVTTVNVVMAPVTVLDRQADRL